MPPRARPPITWWQGIALTFALGGVSALTASVMKNSETTAVVPALHDARDRSDDRNDQGMRDQINDIQRRLGNLEARACR